MISRARFGPVSAPEMWSGITSWITCVMRKRLSRSRPLDRLTIGTHGRKNFLTSPSTARRPCDGTPITMRSASRTASSIESVASSARGSGVRGR